MLFSFLSLYPGAWHGNLTPTCALPSRLTDGVRGCSMKVSPKGWVVAVGWGWVSQGPSFYTRNVQNTVLPFIYSTFMKSTSCQVCLVLGNRHCSLGAEPSLLGTSPLSLGLGAGSTRGWPGPRSWAHPQPALGVGDSCVWSLVGATQPSILLVASPAHGCLSVASRQELLFPITCSLSRFCICSRRPCLTWRLRPPLGAALLCEVIAPFVFAPCVWGCL